MNSENTKIISNNTLYDNKNNEQNYYTKTGLFKKIKIIFSGKKEADHTKKFNVNTTNMIIGNPEIQHSTYKNLHNLYDVKHYNKPCSSKDIQKEDSNIDGNTSKIISSEQLPKIEEDYEADIDETNQNADILHAPNLENISLIDTPKNTNKSTNRNKLFEDIRTFKSNSSLKKVKNANKTNNEQGTLKASIEKAMTDRRHLIGSGEFSEYDYNRMDSFA